MKVEYFLDNNADVRWRLYDVGDRLVAFSARGWADRSEAESSAKTLLGLIRTTDSTAVQHKYVGRDSASQLTHFGRSEYSIENHRPRV